MSKKLTSKRKRSKYWRFQQKITQHGEEAKAEAEVEEAIIVATNNNNTIMKKINFKEEKGDGEAIHQQLKGQSQ